MELLHFLATTITIVLVVFNLSTQIGSFFNKTIRAFERSSHHFFLMSLMLASGSVNTMFNITRSDPPLEYLHWVILAISIPLSFFYLYGSYKRNQQEVAEDTE